MTTDTSEHTGLTSDAEAAIREIDAAANVAAQSLSAFEGAPAGAAAPSDDSRDRESRAAFYAKRSLDQKTRGRKELTKTYVGALSMQKQLVVNDVNISSSAERFLGLIDLAIYTFNRRGAPVLGVAQTEKILDQIQEMATAYSAKAASAKAQAAELMRVAKEPLLDEADWLVPEYTTTALKADMHVKSPVTAGLVKAFMDWDKAIYDLSVLNWNGKAAPGQSAQLKSEERREISALFRFCARSLQGLRKASNPAKKPAGDIAPSESTATAPVGAELAAAA